MEFQNFEELVKQIETDLGWEFNQKFRNERKRLAKLSKLPNQVLFSEFDDKKLEWVYNRGGKKEIQYHIYLRDGELGYGLGINSQRGSFNNEDPAKIANSFGNCFKELYSKIIEILPSYRFTIGSKERLGKMEVEEFLLFGNSIPYNDDNKFDDVHYKSLITDLKKQFQVYIMVFELNNLKKETSILKEKHMRETTDLLLYKKQIILQGPPGTGKTQLAKKLAKKIIDNPIDKLEGHEQFKLVQFHPSYTYEDFVRGIVAKPNEDGDGILYETEDKILGKFAKKALDNFIRSGSTDITIPSVINESNLPEFINFIIDQIDTSEDKKYMLTDNVYIFYVDDRRFKYKGDNWEAHPKGLNMNFSELEKIIRNGARERSDIQKIVELNALSKSHATYYAKILEKYDDFVNNELQNIQQDALEIVIPKKYVLIIDEINRANLSSVLGELIYALEYRGETLDSLYELDDVGNKLIIPPNLYIIGTMNTADRSVGHIDYAIRRRFAFVDVLPKDLTDESEITFASNLFAAVKELFTTDNYITRSTYLSNEFDPKDVALGHSYFIDKSEEKGSMAIRLEYEIQPILFEYVKDGILKGEDIIQKIKELKTFI